MHATTIDREPRTSRLTLQVLEAKKHRKIHLPNFDQLSILCPSDQLRTTTSSSAAHANGNGANGANGAPRPRMNKPRMSSNSLTSDSSGIVSLNLTPTGHNAATAAGLQAAHAAAQQMVVDDHGGHGGHERARVLGNVPAGNANGLQPGLTLASEQSFTWPDGDDSVESVEASFTLDVSA